MVFKVPPPTWQRVVNDIMDQSTSDFARQDFKHSVQKCFNNVGLSPDAFLTASDLEDKSNNGLAAAVSSEGDNINLDRSKLKFKRFALKRHTGNVLQNPQPVSATPTDHVDTLHNNYKPIKSIYDQLIDVRTFLPQTHRKFMQSFAREHGVAGNLSHEDLCTHLCRLVSMDEITERLIQFKKEDNESMSVDKTLTLVSFPDKWAAGNSDSDDSAALDSDYEDSDLSDTDGSDDEDSEN